MPPRSLSMISRIPRNVGLALAAAGYEDVDDLEGLSAEFLAQNLKIGHDEATLLLTIISKRNTFSQAASSPNTDAPPLSQSVSSMAIPSRTYSTLFPSIDQLLSGGLSKGHILEISGPPGSMKEALAINLVHSCVRAGEEVLFVDSQNMSSKGEVRRALHELDPASQCDQQVSYISIHLLLDLMAFMRHLPEYLDSHPKVSRSIALIVLNSLSFAFQATLTMGFPAKTHIYEQLKQTLTSICISRNITVVITSQLSTKVVNADGSVGTFDTGTKGIVVPFMSNAYLPSGRTYRLIIVPETRTSGIARLLASPSHKHGQGSSQASYIRY